MEVTPRIGKESRDKKMQKVYFTNTIKGVPHIHGGSVPWTPMDTEAADTVDTSPHLPPTPIRTLKAPRIGASPKQNAISKEWFSF